MVRRRDVLWWAEIILVTLAGLWTLIHLMDLNYLLAGTVSANPILGMFGIFLCFAWHVCGWIGVDRWLLPAIGLPWKPGTWFRANEAQTALSSEG